MAIRSSTILFRARIDKRRVHNAERILSRIGLTLGQYVNIAFAQVELKNGIPFPLTAMETDDGHLPHNPNSMTVAALAEPTKALHRYSTVAAALERLSPSAQSRSKKSV